jgi:hypothetical protein
MIYQEVENIQGRHAIGNQIDALLFRPTTDEHKQIRVWILGDTSPLLSLSFHFGSFSLSVVVNNDILGGNWVQVQSFNVAGIGIGEGVDVFEGPESGIASPRAFTVFVGDAGDTDRLLVDGDERGGGVEQVEGVPELDVFRAVLLADVECGADFLHLLLRAKRPQTLEFGVVKGQTDGEDLG